MRASRLLSILILLQLRQRLTAEELAGEFEVSIRTIYRDIDALSAAGVPVYGDRGPGGGFQLLEGYRTKLTGLDTSEAEAMLLIGLPGEAQAMGLGDAATRARNKLLAALPKTGSEEANRIAGRFHLDSGDWYRAARPTPFLSRVARAVLDRRVLAMTYKSWKARAEWVVEPYGLVLKAGHWYLIARGHGKVRIFNIADIQSLDLQDEEFERPRDFDLATWWQTEQARFEAELFSTTATLRLSPLGLKRLAAVSPRGAAAAQSAKLCSDGWTLTNMAIENNDHGAREMLMIGAEVEIVSPLSFRERIRRLASGIVALNRGECE
jgi:predicted DNA-binding transcriptional regulator YafY